MPRSEFCALASNFVVEILAPSPHPFPTILPAPLFIFVLRDRPLWTGRKKKKKRKICMVCIGYRCICIGFLAKILRLFASARLGCPEILANRPPFSSNRYIRDIFSREERWSGSNGQRGERKIRRDIFCMYTRFSIRSYAAFRCVQIVFG